MTWPPAANPPAGCEDLPYGPAASSACVDDLCFSSHTRRAAWQAILYLLAIRLGFDRTRGAATPAGRHRQGPRPAGAGPLAHRARRGRTGWWWWTPLRDSGCCPVTAPWKNSMPVAFSPDGQLLVTEGGQVWSLPSGRPVIGVARGALVAFAPDGKRLATGTGPGQITVWNIEPEAPFTRSVPWNTQVQALSLTPDGSAVAVVGGEVEGFPACATPRPNCSTWPPAAFGQPSVPATALSKGDCLGGPISRSWGRWRWRRMPRHLPWTAAGTCCCGTATAAVAAASRSRTASLTLSSPPMAARLPCPGRPPCCSASAAVSRPANWNCAWPPGHGAGPVRRWPTGGRRRPRWLRLGLGTG